MPDTLAQICNDMATNGSICQGFVYNAYTKIAFFKGAGQYTQINTSSQCLSPNTTVWLLSTGSLLYHRPACLMPLQLLSALMGSSSEHEMHKHMVCIAVACCLHVHHQGGSAGCVSVQNERVICVHAQ